MIKFLRVIDNETIEISRYRNPRLVFNSYEYDDLNSYCDLKAIINPFTLYEENEQLKYQLQQKENIINELEKELDRGYLDLFEHELVNGRELIINIKNYIKELKEDNSNE